jgi:hypothetical protein
VHVTDEARHIVIVVVEFVSNSQQTDPQEASSVPVHTVTTVFFVRPVPHVWAEHALNVVVVEGASVVVEGASSQHVAWVQLLAAVLVQSMVALLALSVCVAGVHVCDEHLALTSQHSVAVHEAPLHWIVDGLAFSDWLPEHENPVQYAFNWQHVDLSVVFPKHTLTLLAGPSLYWPWHSMLAAAALYL